MNLPHGKVPTKEQCTMKDDKFGDEFKTFQPNSTYHPNTKKRPNNALRRAVIYEENDIIKQEFEEPFER